MTPEEFRRAGHELVDWIADFRATLETRPVMARTAPGEIARAFPTTPPETPQPIAEIFATLDATIVPGITHFGHPRFFGFFPTGGSLSRKSLEQIAQILEKHPQVWVYADEIYSRLAYTGEFFSIAQLPGMYERTIISDGASKTWAMTGWRIGLTSNPALAPVFTRWITNTDSCASQISQWAAVAAITGPQDAAEMMKKSFLERRDFIVGLLNDVPGVKCLVPDGAFYAWPNVTEACRRIGAADSEEFRKRLLHEAGVAVLADIHFGTRVPGEGQHVRFSYAASKQAIEKGVARMADFIRANTRKAA